MTLLVTQIFFCLLAAALIGGLAVWLLCRNVALRREELFQQDWKNRVRQIESDRDRTVQRLSAEIDALKKTTSQSGKSVVLADYENLVAKLEGQVEEREDAIGELRAEIQSLRGELTESRAAARHRETELLQQHDRESANLMAQLAQRDDPVATERDAELRQRHQQEIDRLTTQVQQHDQALTEREDALRQQHEQDLANLSAQLDQRDDQILAERENALRQEQEISRLKTELAQRGEQDQRDDQLLPERDNALRQEQEQEISRLKTELAQRGEQDASADNTRIAELLAEIELRDDSIAVLRDDIAELNRARTIGQRGRQDDQLRVAMDEATAWQDKYEAAAAELSFWKKQGAGTQTAATGAADSPPVPEPVVEASTKQRERSAGDRIGSVLSAPGGPKDKLQEIRGIGPVLERKLNDIGIYHFRQIAEFDAGDIARVSNELGSFANRINRDDWVIQAQSLHRKYHS